MSRKWVEREGANWIEKGIITEDQYQQIISLYPEKRRVMALLPVFAGILVGLGILTFIASNWQQITHLFRLLLIVSGMTGFYLGGQRMMNKGEMALGISLIGVGLMSFGAGIFLLAQMFQIVTYDARAFIFWALPGVGLTYLYNSRYLFLLTALIVNAGQFYSVIYLQNFSYIIFFLFICGLGVFGWKGRTKLSSTVLTTGILFQGTLFLLLNEVPFTYLLLIAAVLYAAGDWVEEKQVRLPAQIIPLIIALGFAVFFVFTLKLFNISRMGNPAYFIPALLVILVFSFLGKRRRGEVVFFLDWILFLPFFYWKEGGDLFYLLLLFFFSGYLLWFGYRQEWRLKVNVGTALFLASTFIGYVQVAWSFMPKSLFFLFGGIILFALNWFLRRRLGKIIFQWEDQGSTRQDGGEQG